MSTNGATTRPTASWRDEPANRTKATRRRRVEFTNRDLQPSNQLAGSEYVAGRYNPPRVVHPRNIRRAERSVQYSVGKPSTSTDRAHRSRDGRYINDGDLEARRKVAVIGRAVERDLFRGQPALGQYIQLGDMPFLVIGVFTDEGGEREEEKIYVPLSTGQVVWRGGDRLNDLLFTVSEDADEETIENIEASLRSLLGKRHHFDPTDRRAIRVRNNLASYMDVREALTLGNAIWLVELGTLLAGVVGVAFLLVSVRERTPEIGLRGARRDPLADRLDRAGGALFLTSVANYLGLLAGVGAVGHPMDIPHEYIRDPEVHIGIGLMATALITILGTLAGAICAFHAARINRWRRFVDSESRQLPDAEHLSDLLQTVRRNPVRTILTSGG